MDSEEVPQQNNTFEDDDQRIQILTEKASNNENDAKMKEYIDQLQNAILEKTKLCHEKELKNSEIKRKLEQEAIQRNEFVKLLTSFNTIMNNNIENLNLLRDLIQSSLNDQNTGFNLEQDVSELFDKLKQQKFEKEKNLIDQINYLKPYSQQCKADHAKNMENFSLMESQLLKNIHEKKNNIDTIKSKIDTSHKNKEKINLEIKNVENETTILLNKIPEVEKQYHEIENEQEINRNKYKQKLFDLQTDLDEKRENFTKKKLEIENFEDGLTCKIEFISSLQKQKENANEKLANIKENCSEMDEKITEINVEIEKETKNNNIDIENLTQELESLKENNNKLDIVHKNNLLTLQSLNNEEMLLKNNIKTSESLTIKTKKEIDELQELMEEQFLKFGAEIATLEKNVNEETQKENAEDKDLEQILAEMKKAHEEFMLQNEGKLTELDVEAIQAEMDTNLLKDEIKDIKQEVENVRQEVSDKKHEIKIKQDKIEKDENKLKNLSSNFEKLKLKLTNQHQNNIKRNSNELEKIKDTKKTLDLQISEMTVSTKILQNEVTNKIKERKDMKNKLNNDQTENKTVNKNKIYSKIPTFKIPTSKYSSTSDDSMDENPGKKRKITFKRRVDIKKSEPSQKSTQQQCEKMSVENILKSINTPPKRATRKRTIKKPVY